MSNFINQFNKVSSLSTTEKGAISYKTSNLNNNLVAALYTISQYRDIQNAHRFESIVHFQHALTDNNLHDYCIRFALMVRDIECGAGERGLGRELLKNIFDSVELSEAQIGSIINKLVDENVGRWDDVIYLAENCDKPLVRNILNNRIVDQLKSDIGASTDERISLLGKWMPSINAGKQSRVLAIKWANKLKMTYSQYRKTLVRLRNKIDIVESKITSNRYDQINYSAVPSLAFSRYINTFRKHDRSRFKAFIQQVQQNHAKINTSTNSVAELVNLYSNNRYNQEVNDIINTMWNNWNVQQFNRNVLPICDVSGSMVGNKVGKLSCLDVSVGLSIYASQANKGIFHNKIIAFSRHSDVVSLSDQQSFTDKIKQITAYSGFNTNLELVLENVLQIAIRGKCTADEIPTLVFFSDMEYDEAFVRNFKHCGTVNFKSNEMEALFDQMSERYRSYGYELPKLVFWNIDNRSATIPKIENDRGLILVSGYSENLVSMIFSDQMDPWNTLKEQLDNPRYVI